MNTGMPSSGSMIVDSFPDGAGFNPGYRLAKNPIYPGITEDYRRTHHFLEMLKPDIWLAQHNEYYDLEGKRERAKTEGVSAWIDPEGYRRFVAGRKRAFEDQVDLEMGMKKDAAQGLGGTSWQLVAFEGGDGTTLTPDDRGEYTIAFGEDERVAVRLDCNRGSGTWKSAQRSQLQFGPLALTRAMCREPALHDRLAKDWTAVRSYVLKDGHLFLSLMADGGVYEFEPLTDGAEHGTRRPTRDRRSPQRVQSDGAQLPAPTSTAFVRAAQVDAAMTRHRPLASVGDE